MASARRTPSSPLVAALGGLRLPNIHPRLRDGRRSPLARACAAAPGQRLHDALAGWGTDGLVLAALGCHVHMSERNPTVYQVLQARLAQCRELAGTLTWALEDARTKWRENPLFDVVYLDPMFGAHPKSALPAKHMQVLAELADEPGEDETAALVEKARRVAASRVVVKRRAHAPPHRQPDWQIRARSVRFDIYRPVATRETKLRPPAVPAPDATPRQ